MDADPLDCLPPEVILQVLDFASIDTIANLTCVSRAWHKFIDDTHQDTIYSSQDKVLRPANAKDFSFLSSTTSFAKYYEDVKSWKDLCKRQTLLDRAWNESKPTTRESVFQINNDPVWRFRPDFKRRFFVSTSQTGGLSVTDMDNGRLIWRLPSVRPYARLEYEDGMAVFDREGQAVEVWRTDIGGLSRGQFQRTAIIPFDCRTRGFHLAYNTLCVVSDEGHGFVYDMKPSPPILRIRLDIEENAVGHLYQDQDVVMYSMGTKGYHFYDKTSGRSLGSLKPERCSTFYNIGHPNPPTSHFLTNTGNRDASTSAVFPPKHPRNDRLTQISIHTGVLPGLENPDAALENDEWGAGVLCGSLMVGVSRHGRVFICTDWFQALRNPDAFKDFTSIVECQSDSSGFDLGGWLSISDNRVMFEVQDRIYIMALDDIGRVQQTTSPKRPSWSLPTGSRRNFAPILGRLQRMPAAHEVQPEEDEGPARIFSTKAIRILSFAPELTCSDDEPRLWKPQMSISKNGRFTADMLAEIASFIEARMRGNELFDGVDLELDLASPNDL